MPLQQHACTCKICTRWAAARSNPFSTRRPQSARRAPRPSTPTVPPASARPRAHGQGHLPLAAPAGASCPWHARPLSFVALHFKGHFMHAPTLQRRLHCRVGGPRGAPCIHHSGCAGSPCPSSHLPPTHPPLFPSPPPLPLLPPGSLGPAPMQTAASSSATASARQRTSFWRAAATWTPAAPRAWPRRARPSAARAGRLPTSAWRGAAGRQIARPRRARAAVSRGAPRSGVTPLNLSMFADRAGLGSRNCV